jgi:thiamine biosynthesis lipoprotein
MAQEMRTHDTRHTTHVLRITIRVSLCLCVLVSCLTIQGCGQGQKIYKKKFIAAGTYIEVTSPRQEAARIVIETMREAEKIFNLYDKDSDISRLNAAAGIKPVRVSRELIETIELSKDLYKLTKGAFDPSIGKLTFFWKEKITGNRLKEFPSPDQIETLRKYKGLNLIDTDNAQQTAFIEKEGIVLDLGGIAKGYMVDKAVAALQAAGIDSALINAGGDMYCLGTKQGRPWQIGIRNPKTIAGVLDTLAIRDEAIATSGDYEQFFTYEGIRHSHLIDPDSGLPVKGAIRSVTVIAHNATTADGLATAFFIMGKAAIERFVRENTTTLRIFVVEEGKDKNLTVHCFL